MDPIDDHHDHEDDDHNSYDDNYEDDYYYDDDIFDDNYDFGGETEDHTNDIDVNRNQNHVNLSDNSNYNHSNYVPTEFNQHYRALPFSSIEKSHLEPGNRIILPLSACDVLISIGLEFPMLFSIENPSTGQSTHCGVLEFTAEEGFAFIPSWLMKNLNLENGELIKLKNVTLETAKYIKIQSHSVDFFDIRKPKEVLEVCLCAGYSCVTVGDTIMITVEGKQLVIDIIDAKPSTAVCLIATDCAVEFSAPLDYIEPSKAKVRVEEKDAELSKKFAVFSGRARKLNEAEGSSIMGKEVVGVGKLEIGDVPKEKNKVSSSSSAKKCPKSSCECDEEAKEQSSFKPFTGNKYTIRDL